MTSEPQVDTLRTYLPFELQDAVISTIDSPRDLAAFAATCKYWAGLIMPRHVEYRKLQISSTARPVRSFETSKNVWVDTSMPRSIEHRTARLSKPLLDVLFHLASSPAFTRNIREVKVTDRRSSLPDIYPRSLVDPFKPLEPTTNWKGSLWVFYMLQALSNMKSLHKFTWDMPLDPSLGTTVDTSKPGQEQKAMFEVLRQSKTLTSLHVQIDRTMHYENFGSDDYPLWHIGGLTSLTLSGPHGWLSCSGLNFTTMLQRNSLLQELTISYLPSNAIHFKSFYFPHLRKLCLRHAGLVEIAEDEDKHILSFLYAHPTIEDLQWRSTFDSGVRPGLLPNLKRIETNAGLAYSFLRDVTIPQRKWEAISSMVVFERTMPALRKIDGSHVKKLMIERFDSLELVDEIAGMFPNVTQLNITDFGIQTHHHSLEECIATLSKFRFLVYFQDSHLWNRIQFLPNEERKAIVSHLAAACPHMTRIGGWYSEDGTDVCAVLIRDGENVTWRDETCLDS